VASASAASPSQQLSYRTCLRNSLSAGDLVVMLGVAWLMGFGYTCLLDNAACIYCFTLRACGACGAVISVLTHCFEGPLFRKATVQIFTTVLGFGLWLGLVGIVDIRNSGPKSLFHACFVCTLIFCFCFQIFM